MNFREIEKMLGLAESAAQTRVYQEGVEQSQKDIALRMLKRGMELELIAEITDLTIDQIKALRPLVEDESN
jgi:predicted transposase YdaD